MPTNNSINSQDPIQVAKGGTGQSTLTTANGILAAGTTATGAIQNIGTGSAGQVLTSNGTSLPSFQAAGSGDYVLLKTDSPSSAASVIYDNTYITTNYKTYVVIFNDVDSTGLELFVSDDNGATYKTTGYTSGFFSLAYNNTSVGNNNSTTAGLVTNSGVTNFSANMMIYNLQSAQRTCWSGMGWCLNSFWMTIAGENSTTNINNIKFQPNSGNITNGSFKLYGLK